MRAWRDEVRGVFVAENHREIYPLGTLTVVDRPDGRIALRDGLGKDPLALPWQRWRRGDGTGFATKAECIAFLRTQNTPLPLTDPGDLAAYFQSKGAL